MVSNIFIQTLRREIKDWVEKKLITAKTAEKIIDLYPIPVEAVKSKDTVSKKIPVIVIGFAITLISIGLILFYAANWKYMPISAKLVQIFLFIIISYGLSFYFLGGLTSISFVESRKKISQSFSKLLGRGFLILGMISYGVGIMLVAQIFHISAHPTNGILLWAVGSLAISIVLKEKVGYYVSLVLIFIWNSWEVSFFDNPNYLLGLFLLLFTYLFYKKEDKIGLLMMILFSFMYFFQITSIWMEFASFKDYNHGIIIYILILYSFGVFLFSFANFINKNKLWQPSRYAIYFFSLILLIIPFVALSWTQSSKVLHPLLSSWGWFFSLYQWVIKIL